MQPLRSWSFGKVLLVSIAWSLFSILAVVAWVALTMTVAATIDQSGGGGIGAVSIGINELVLAIPAVPPIILIGLWLAARLRRLSSPKI